MTVLLNKRQQIAEAMTRDLRGHKGVWVVSPLPLADSQKLRVQIADMTRNEVVQKLKDWGYSPVFLSVAPRFDVMGLTAASVYEVDIPHERQPIPQDARVIPKDEVGRRERDLEAAKMIEAIYGGIK